MTSATCAILENIDLQVQSVLVSNISSSLIVCGIPNKSSALSEEDTMPSVRALGPNFTNTHDLNHWGTSSARVDVPKCQVQGTHLRNLLFFFLVLYVPGSAVSMPCHPI